MGLLGCGPSQYDWCPYKVSSFEGTLAMHVHRGNTLRGHSKAAAICKSRGEASEGKPSPATTFILDI